MHWLTARSVVVSLPRWRSLRLLFPTQIDGLNKHSPLSSPCSRKVQCSRVCYYGGRKSLKKTRKTTKKHEESKSVLDDKDYLHIMWWKEKIQLCRKASTVSLVERLTFSNLLGLDANLRNGSIKEGTLNWELLQFKSRFPREVLLCRVGEFYEAVGVDACILVEYAGLNPCGGAHSNSIPRAGCPIMNLQQTLDELTHNGYSVCIVEEVQVPTKARSRKGRFVSGHAHPGSPYVFGLVEVDHDLDFPEPMPVVGISRLAKGYSLTLIQETLKTFSSEDGLTEEALVTKLRTCRYHYLFLHASLKHSSSGTYRWGEFGEGGLLWAECCGKHYDWFDGDPVTTLFVKVKEIYGIDDEVKFRDVTVSSGKRPHPLHLGTATQIGVIPTEGIPSLLQALLPSNCTGLPVLYIRDLILNPPPYSIAFSIQETCKNICSISCPIPEFTCISSAKIVKLLELREANHLEFCRIKNVLDEILLMHKNPDLNMILQSLMDPTWVSTGLRFDFETFVNECECASRKIGKMISLESDNDQKITYLPHIPNKFFEDMEDSWKGRVKRIHAEEAYAEAEMAAEALSLAVSEDFVPIISRIKASVAPLGGPRGEILYVREHSAVWFKGRRFAPEVWAGTLGEDQIKQLRRAVDSKSRKVGEDLFTTVKVECALTRYHEAGANAKAKVLELLRGLSADLETKINILVFASMLLVIAKALFSLVSEGRRKRWIFPTVAEFSDFQNMEPFQDNTGMKITGLSPYWIDEALGGAVRNTVDMQSLYLLTGPNGGGKSSLLRSICAAAILGICGIMVPAESALIPHFDSIMLHMKSNDSPADGKSSFQIEMSEMRSIIRQATSRSLVLVDEICRGTETVKGTCIAAGIIETLDRIRCLGIVSTHLHGLFALRLDTKNTVHKAMGTEEVDGQPKPTWKLVDGICRESLAFETALKEGVPETIIRRAKELFHLVNAEDSSSEHEHSGLYVNGSVGNATECISDKVGRAIKSICLEKMNELCKQNNLPEMAHFSCVAIGAREVPPPSTIGSSAVYVMFRSDTRLYVGETDDLEGRISTHRSKEGTQCMSFIYFLVPGKSVACQLETLLINQLPKRGFILTNIADGKHRKFGTSSNLYLDSVA